MRNGGDSFGTKRTPNRAELARKQLASDMGAVLLTPAGRRFVMHLIEQRCFVSSRVPTGPDGLRIEGRRDVGIELMGEIQALHPALWDQMYLDARKAAAEESIHRKDAEREAVALANQEISE